MLGVCLARVQGGLEACKYSVKDIEGLDGCLDLKVRDDPLALLLVTHT